MVSSKSDEVVSQFRFPLDVQRQLLETIGDKRVCGELELRCLGTSAIPEWRSMGAIKEDIVKVHKAVRKLLHAVELTGWESGVMLRMAAEMSPDEEIRKLNIKGKPDENVDFLEGVLDQIVALEKVLATGIDALPTGPGRKRKSSPLFQALAVLETFYENKLPATSYRDGQYFRVLEIVFEAIFPDIGEEAYRRYGESALREWPRYCQFKSPIT